MPKKIIIEIGGGLGNQMFQYAFYLKFLSLGFDCELYFDPSEKIHNGFELNKVFDLGIGFCNSSEIENLLFTKPGVFNKIKKKIINFNYSHYWEHDKGYDFKPEVFNQKKSIYLQGCWLSEKYFSDISLLVRDAFIFRGLNHRTLKMRDQISLDPNAVSMHIRKGDYTKSKVHQNIDYLEYLDKGINYISQFVKRPSLYIFSDDIEYSIELMKSFKRTKMSLYYIDWNIGTDAFNDMYLMSLCKHNIIANSTFSWWAAWLNVNKDKKVISPKKWFTTLQLNRNSIVPETWVTI